MDAALIYTFNAFALPLLVIATIYISIRALSMLTAQRAPEQTRPGPALGGRTSEPDTTALRDRSS